MNYWVISLNLTHTYSNQLKRVPRLKFFYVKTRKFGIASQQHTVNDELDELERYCGGDHVAGVQYVADRYCDPCTIGVQFLEADLTDKLTEGDLFSLFDWDVLTFDEKVGVGAYNTLFLGGIFTFANALSQTSNFVCIRFLPHLFESWMVAQLAPLEAFS